MGGTGQELGRRLRERDLAAAPAALNLMEDRSARGARADRRAAAGGLPRRAGRRGARPPGGRHRAARGGQVVPAQRADRRVARPGPVGGRAGGGPLLQALRRLAAGRPRPDRRTTRATRVVLIRSTAAGRPAGRAGRAHPRGRRGAGRRLRPGGDRDRGRGPVRDRRRGGVRHRGRGGPARLGRHPPVPQGGDHGGARRPGGDQGRPGRGGRPRAPRPDHGAGLAGLARRARGGHLGRPAARNIASWPRPSTPTARAWTCRARRPGPAHERAGRAGGRARRVRPCAPWVGAGRPSGCWSTPAGASMPELAALLRRRRACEPAPPGRRPGGRVAVVTGVAESPARPTWARR